MGRRKQKIKLPIEVNNLLQLWGVSTTLKNRKHISAPKKYTNIGNFRLI